MFFYLGGQTVVDDRDVIGIFDMDLTTVSAKTREYLRISQKRNIVRETTGELPKSFVVCNKAGTINDRVYITQLNVSTLKNRAMRIGDQI